MRIKKIAIENLYGISGLQELELPDIITAFWGDNGAGKTSIIDSIRFALDGQIKPRTKNHYANDGYVSITLDTDDVLTRSISSTGKSLTQKVTLNGRKITQQDATAFMTDKLDIPSKNLKTFTSGELTDALTNDISKVMASYMDGTVEKEKVISLIVSHEKDNTYITREDIEDALKNETENLSVNTDIARLAKFYVEKRKTTKVKGKEQSERLKLLNITKEELDKEKIEEELSLLRVALQTGEAEKKLFSTWEESEKRRAAILERISTLKTESDSILLPDQTENIDALQLRKNELISEISNYKAKSNSSEQEISRYESIKASLKCGNCPLSTADVTVECKTDMSGVVKEIAKLIEQAEKQKTDADEKVKMLSEEMAKLETRIQIAAKVSEDITKKKNLQERIRDLEKTVPEMTEKPKDTDISAVKTKIEELEGKLKQLSAREEAAQIREKIKILAKEVYVADAIANALDTTSTTGKKGYVITSLMEEYIELLNKAADKSYSITNVKTTFTYNDNRISVEFKTRENDMPRPYYLLSTAEKLVANHTVADLLMRLSGYSICLIDDLDRLDDKNLDKFMALLEKNKDSYGNIIIAGVGHNGTKEILESHGATVMECSEE